jgi:hypothetical protein
MNITVETLQSQNAALRERNMELESVLRVTLAWLNDHAADIKQSDDPCNLLRATLDRKPI